MTLAAKHPDVAFLQQGNYMTPPVPANADTYFGNVYETVYLAGIAAGKATKSSKLGFVAAFPIPQTLLNIDAFRVLERVGLRPEVDPHLRPVDLTDAFVGRANASLRLTHFGIDPTTPFTRYDRLASCLPVATFPFGIINVPAWSYTGPVNGDQPLRIFVCATVIFALVAFVTDGPYGARSIGDAIPRPPEKPSE